MRAVTPMTPKTHSPMTNPATQWVWVDASGFLASGFGALEFDASDCDASDGDVSDCDTSDGDASDGDALELAEAMVFSNAKVKGAKSSSCLGLPLMTRV